MRPGDGFVFLFEYDQLNPTQLARFPRRPARLTLGSQRPYECFGDSWMVRFRDRGRAFQAHVYGPASRRSQALAFLDSLRVRPSPFDPRLRAAAFPEGRPWHVRVSGPIEPTHCHDQRVSWASTVPFTDGSNSLPPHSMIAALAPDGIILAAVQFVDRCRGPFHARVLRLPLRLRGADRSDFPGPRGDELPLFRAAGRFAGRYEVDLWAFFGRRRPTAAQWAAAQRELDGVRWPAGL
jgi:hypothetical protein